MHSPSVVALAGVNGFTDRDVTQSTSNTTASDAPTRLATNLNLASQQRKSDSVQQLYFDTGNSQVNIAAIRN